jgi:hypothetical protein
MEFSRLGVNQLRDGIIFSGGTLKQKFHIQQFRRTILNNHGTLGTRAAGGSQVLHFDTNDTEDSGDFENHRRPRLTANDDSRKLTVFKFCYLGFAMNGSPILPKRFQANQAKYQ